MTNLALMTLPVVPTRRGSVCFFSHALLKSENCLIVKRFYSLSNPFRFQALIAFYYAMKFESSEPLGMSYPLKYDRWPSFEVLNRHNDT